MMQLLFKTQSIVSKKSFTPKDSLRICQHMNADHQEAVVAYARHYGHCPEAKKAKMLLISSHTMTLDVEGKSIEIMFDHVLSDSKDAHQTLVSMLKKIPPDN